MIKRLAKDAGFMSACFLAALRAVAIDLADQGKSAAGGFILPNDRVDVIRVFHPDDAPGAFASETILTNVRVLAVGQAVQDKAGERTVIGGTATLELTPDQAEKVVLAQRTGQLTLTLRSVADAAKLDKAGRRAANDDDHPLRQHQPIAGALMTFSARPTRDPVMTISKRCAHCIPDERQRPRGLGGH